MYSKIAFGNVKKSFKDYTIYFLTLTLAVCIFYSFNSIESQTAFMQMEESTSANIEMLATLISYLSVFVSVILGSLILYANNFLIKKRKKELGIYTILGMSKKKISKILVLETLLVGALSLVSGLALGLIVSQGLSIFTAKLFDVTMSEFHFIISGAAILKTILYFGLMFLLVILFNTYVMSKYKIIDLLNANKKIETIKSSNPLLYTVTFIASLISLFFAYRTILETGFILGDKFMLSVVLGILGTFLFFFSLANISLILLQKNKSAYYKHLNIFITKQLSSKVHTNYISISFICLMLFLTIGILSTGISFKNALESDLEDLTPFSASAYVYSYESSALNDVEQSLLNTGYSFDDNAQYMTFTEYYSGIAVRDFLNHNLSDSTAKDLEKMSMVQMLLISESDYNKINKLANRELVSLANDEVLFLSNANLYLNVVNEFLANNDTVVLDNQTLRIKNKTAIEDVLYSSSFKTNFLTLVVKDELVTQLEPNAFYLNVNFSGAKAQASEQELAETFHKFFDGKVDLDKSDFVIGYTRTELYESTKGMTIVVLFIGIYLGIIFLISSMAVLALQQLSEASDSTERYRSLRKIGATDKMINKTIFVQTVIYFTLPIALALVHSVVGIKVVNDFIAMYNQPNIGVAAIMTALIFLTVYLGYFYATYTGYKNIVKQS